MTLKIISAEDVLFQGEVTMVNLPGTKGAFAVLHNHASLVSTLSAGTIRYSLPEGDEQSLAVLGGIVDIDNNVVSVCIY